jgi:indole-3-glycerol phosphate synthase
MLKEGELRSLAALAGELNMAALIEVHDAEEFALAQKIDAELIGINNRDLHTFKTDIATTESLLRAYDGDALIVSESGIETAADIGRLSTAGASAFLIGESLLRGGAPREALATLTAARGGDSARK